MEGRVQAVEMKWTRDQVVKVKEEVIKGDLDFVIGSDLCYLKEEFDNLIDCLCLVAAKDYTKVILCCTDHGNLGIFQQKLAENGKLKVEEVSRDYMDEDYQAEDIKTYLITKVKD